MQLLQKKILFSCLSAGASQKKTAHQFRGALKKNKQTYWRFVSKHINLDSAVRKNIKNSAFFGSSILVGIHNKQSRREGSVFYFHSWPESQLAFWHKRIKKSGIYSGFNNSSLNCQNMLMREIPEFSSPACVTISLWEGWPQIIQCFGEKSLWGFKWFWDSGISFSSLDQKKVPRKAWRCPHLKI